jgi:regulator of sigma E protease
VFSVKLTPKAQTIYGAGLSIAYINHPTPINQFVTVCTMTWKSIQGIFYNIVGNKLKLTDKKSSIGAKHLSGPLGIVERIYASVYYGSFIQGLFFIVIITFSLGLFNLLPIPVLDGGHIVFATLEIIMGRKLPNSIMKPLIIVCIAGLLSLMVYATVNDTARIVNDGKEEFFIKLAPAGIEKQATVDAETAATKKKPVKNDANKTN